ncbi:MAG: hypothetical protein FJX76_02925 [Armatimonadetes bacterium]|nr:hypothetical protein [Armatimonadota bacterium]
MPDEVHQPSAFGKREVVHDAAPTEVIVDEGTPWVWVALSLVFLLGLLLFFAWNTAPAPPPPTPTVIPQRPATVEVNGPGNVPAPQATVVQPTVNIPPPTERIPAPGATSGP